MAAASDFLDDSDGLAQDVRSRVTAGVDQVTNGISDIRDQAQHFYGGEDHTLGHVVTFVVGLGVGLLFAPGSGAIGSRFFGAGNPENRSTDSE